MNTEFFTFGEVLWDCLPSGRHAGGAPFNVAAHLAHLGSSVSLLSAVGQDVLGDELLQIARQEGVETQFVNRARLGLPTGTVQVTLDRNANAAYTIVQPVAWDEIAISTDASEAVAKSQTLIFGSLAGRSPGNVTHLNNLLSLPGPRKFFDVNLRAPFVDPELIVSLARRTDVIKLNEEEIGQFVSWVRPAGITTDSLSTMEDLVESCAVLADVTDTSCICVTRGPQGALLWDSGKIINATPPQVVVEDTVGAGDAFMAGLVVGLTRGADPQKVLNVACRLGAYVASQRGATPALPAKIIEEISKIV